MKRRIVIWELLGFILTSIGGTILHFLYDWLGNPLWIAPFSAVNESTFEHMKLIFWPMLGFAFIQSFFFQGIQHFWCVKLKGILLGTLLIPVIFYTARGAFGTTPDWFNIAIFFISAAIAYIYETKQLSKRLWCRSPMAAFAVLIIIALAFITLTFRTPQIDLFRDPINGFYGII